MKNKQKNILDDQLFEAIEEFETEKILTLLKNGANPNALSDSMLEKGFKHTPLIAAIDEMTFGGDIKSVHLLLQYGAKVNFPNVDGYSTPLSVAVGNGDQEVVQLLINLGADPNIKGENFTLPLFDSIDNRNLEISKLLLSKGGVARINNIGYPPCGCIALDRAAANLDTEAITLLLDHGADPSTLNEDGDDARWYLPKKEKPEPASWQTAYDLLDPNQLPYLKLGPKETEKYIIYQKKEDGSYLLGSLDSIDDRQYLYHGIDLALFIHWAAMKGLIIDKLQQMLHIKPVTQWSHQQLINAIRNTLNNDLLSDYFTEEGKNFAVAYLTVTNWFYNLHYDLKKLYPEESGFAVFPETEAIYHQILKLLDMRYEQHRSDQWFNANESKQSLKQLLSSYS